MGRRRQRGFTITEALITLLILAIGLAGVSRLQREVLRGFGQAKARSEALALAEQQLETLRTVTQPEAYSADDSGELLHLAGTNSRYDLHWQITPASLGDHYRLHISVQWQDPAGDQEITLDAIIPATDPALPARVLSLAPAP
jgi:prepilin-type N-terminal cleavage/methylation domain-containing protein